jgi:energy-coupling factor transporter ATP-binding protein EcfA2
VGHGSAPAARKPEAKKAPPPSVKFWTPSELVKYEPPPDQNMVGDYHIQRGAFAVLAGPPGCGKSRAILHLALAGAIGRGSWFGLDVHTRFRTLLLQNENGLARLHRDLKDFQMPADIDDWLRISEPPPLGLAIGDPKFRVELKAVLKDFAPGLLVVDPWNALCRDAMEKDTQEAFDRLRDVIAESPVPTATMIIHHLRKPKAEDRHRGRGLANLLAGSYTITSIPRSVLVLQPATDDTMDNRLVMTPAKNNDGELGNRTAWERTEGGFLPVIDFDWEEYENAGKRERGRSVTSEHIIRAFGDDPELKVSEAAARLQPLANVGRSAAYEALKVPGPFSDILEKTEDGKKLRLRRGF